LSREPPNVTLLLNLLSEHDVSRMSREERNALKRRILAQHPELVQDLRPVD
jgi:hypothetical protein